MTVVNADYLTSLAVLQGHIYNGTAPSADEQKALIAIIRNAATRLGTAYALSTTSTDVTTQMTTVTTAKAALVTQFGLLAPLNIATITGDIPGAATLIAAAVAVWATQNTALATVITQLTADALAITVATPVGPTLVTNTVMDG